jgi:hypothetical protein
MNLCTWLKSRGQPVTVSAACAQAKIELVATAKGLVPCADSIQNSKLEFIIEQTVIA